MNKLLLSILILGCIFTTNAASIEAIENPPVDLFVCDDNDDGFALFDLTQNDAIVLGNQNPADFNISYHLTQAGASANTGSILNPASFVNIISVSMTIFIRVEEAANSDLFEIGVFNLIVNPLPSPISIPDVMVCGDNEDGIGFFDLQLLQDDILNGETSVSLSFHETLDSAELGTPAIDTTVPYASISNTQTIYVRATDIDPLTTTECFRVITITLITTPIPVTTTPENYEVCDDDNDGIFDAFVLSSRNNEITNGEPNLEVTYFLTEADAINAPVGLELDDMMYININPFFQTVYARVESTITGCFTVVSVNLIILNTPIPNVNPQSYEVCDDNGDGLAVFDLTSQENQILDGLDPTIFTVTWFVDQAAVDANVAISDPSTYISNTNTVIAVVTDIAQSTTTFCSQQVLLELIVSPLPILSQNTPFDYTFCEEFDGDDTMGEIDLLFLASDAGFLAPPQNVADFNISYHSTESEAANNAFPIDQSSLLTVSDGMELFFRIENISAGCTSMGSIIFTVETRPEANLANDIIRCASNPGVNGIPIQGSATFDLTQQNDIITGGEPNTSVMYYTSLEDAQNMVNSISDPASYMNTSNPQTIYAQAINLNSFCVSAEVIEFMISVTPLPFIDLDETCLIASSTVMVDGNVASPIAGVSYTYNWTLDGVVFSTNPVITINQEGLYQITSNATYDNGISCNYTASITILECTEDSDNDGIPDEDEDLNNNGDLDDDDTDNDDIPNYLDDDDDGDLVMTIDEITGIGAGFAPQDFIDTDDDLIENYLDNDDDGDSVLTRDEDYNNSGSPLDDDTNDNGIPDFLDPEVALSTDDFILPTVSVYPNPVNSVMIVENIDSQATIIIYDTLGRAVLSFVNDQTMSYSIDVSTLTKGLYFMKVANRKPITFIKN